jgi:phage terminase large subunit
LSGQNLELEIPEHLELEIPEHLEALFHPRRYKVLYGGRGGAKSWSIARALLILGARSKLRILCAREFQSSIVDSVHRLLSDQIAEMGMSRYYTVEKATISGINGTEFRFAGIRTNINTIRSFEGIDVCWVEEAANVSAHSWETLVPTIRKDGSEIWVSFNPELETDETYQRFVVSPPSDAIVIKTGWEENPWFPETLAKESDDLKERSLDRWMNVYGGACRHTMEGAVFGDEIRELDAQARITSVPWVPAKSVQTFWDFGKRDMTSIWFAQVIGFEFHIIDFYENCGKQLAHYMKVLKERPYAYGQNWLPHDADHDLLASERTISQQMRAEFSSVTVIQRTLKTTQIEAARSIFNQCWFDRERTQDGLQHLRHYQYEIDDKTGQRSKEPLHDEHSHAADAFMALGMALRERRDSAVLPPFVPKPIVHRPGAWMR